MSASIVSLFEQAAAQGPDKRALVAGSNGYTYDQLHRRSSALANSLAHIVRKGDRVAFCFSQEPEAIIITILALLKLGAVYVPIDPRNPRERIAYILESVQPLLVVGDSETKILFEEAYQFVQYSVSDTLSAVTALLESVPVATDDAAYIIFTSGSTGAPKGVVVSHGNLAAAFCAWEEAYRLPDISCHLQVAGYSFDVFAGDWIRALCSGAELVMCSEEALKDPALLYSTIETSKVECIEFLPTLLRSLIGYMESENVTFSSMKLLICGSDTWYISEYFRFKRLLPKDARLINSYGTSETAIDTSYFEFTSDNQYLENECTHVPIGKPFTGMEMLILNEEKGEVPHGNLGELYIGGSGVSLGYLHAPDLNAQKFVVLEPGGPRYFRTGDYARFLTSGDVEFIGRSDSQIKFRGRRIDIGEIENAVLSLAIVQNATLLLEGTGDAQELHAYVVPANPDAPNLEQAMRTLLLEKLPDYMVPGRYTFMPTLPTNLNGKIDRKAIERHDFAHD